MARTARHRSCHRGDRRRLFLLCRAASGAVQRRESSRELRRQAVQGVALAGGGGLCRLDCHSPVAPVGEWCGPGSSLSTGSFESAPMGTLIAALLMVSRFSYPHFGRQLVRGRRSLGLVVQAILVLAIVALAPYLAFLVLFWAYALSGPAKALIYGRPRRLTEAEARLQ